MAEGGVGGKTNSQVFLLANKAVAFSGVDLLNQLFGIALEVIRPSLLMSYYSWFIPGSQVDPTVKTFSPFTNSKMGRNQEIALITVPCSPHIVLYRCPHID